MGETQTIDIGWNKNPKGQDIIGVQVELDYVQFAIVVKYATGNVIRKSR